MSKKIIYYRRISPEWEKILDSKLEELRAKESASQRLQKKFLTAGKKFLCNKKMLLWVKTRPDLENEYLRLASYFTGITTQQLTLEIIEPEIVNFAEKLGITETLIFQNFKKAIISIISNGNNGNNENNGNNGNNGNAVKGRNGNGI